MATEAMPSSSTLTLKWLIGVLAGTFLGYATVQAQAADNTRPFWTEKSSYVEGNSLYSVGVATRASTPELGRQQAYENGTRELSNFAKVTDLSGLTIETQMTYEERNADGTFNVFRLLKVTMAQLTAWKAQLLERATVAVREQQHTVADETAKLEQEAQQLESLMEREQEIRETVRRLSRSVAKVRCGMTRSEVKELLGTPRAMDPEPRTSIFGVVERDDIFGRAYWNYGDKWLSFENGILIAVHEGKTSITGLYCPR